MRDDPRTIDATENLLIHYDPDDNWLAIRDKDNSWYEDIGSVIFDVDEIDALIEQLGRVKNSIKLRTEPGQPTADSDELPGVSDVSWRDGRPYGPFEAELSDD